MVEPEEDRPAAAYENYDFHWCSYAAIGGNRRFAAIVMLSLLEFPSSAFGKSSHGPHPARSFPKDSRSVLTLPPIRSPAVNAETRFLSREAIKHGTPGRFTALFDAPTLESPAGDRFPAPRLPKKPNSWGVGRRKR